MRNIKSIVQKVYQKIIDEDYTIETIEELCTLIGISKKTFYKEYPSKEQFIFDLLSYFNEELVNDLEKLIENEYESVLKVITIFQILVYKTRQRDKIQEFYGKQNQVTEFFAEIYRMVFINSISKLLEKMNDDGVLNTETNFHLFSEVLIKFTIYALKNNSIKNNETNSNLMVNNLLINALKGICNVSEHSKIDAF
jgi:AcrR family transcriptional regulator